MPLQPTNAGLKFGTPKNGKARRVSLLKFTTGALIQHRKEQAKERKLFGKDYEDHDLVRTLPDGRPWPPNSFTAEVL